MAKRMTLKQEREKENEINEERKMMMLNIKSA